MKNKKSMNGITLISLIITIIVMLILAGIVLMFAIGEEGIIRQAEVAEEKSKKAQKEEEIILEISAYSIETGVPSDKFLIFYDNEKDSIYYKYDVTEEQKEKLEEKGIQMLRGDVNFDGIITQEDADLYKEYVNGEVVIKDINKFGDLNFDGAIDIYDTGIIQAVVNGDIKYEQIYGEID